MVQRRFLQSVQDFIEARALLPEGAGVLVGVSGGVDSVVLLDVLCRLGYGVHAAHVNFQLRAGKSDSDERFVQDLCRARKVPCTVERVDTAGYARREGQSIQMAARALRYRTVAACADRRALAYVAAGHHADDQAETVLLNLLRGSGPEGLAGMPAARALGTATLVRPLLNQTRRSIAGYARDAALQWREDPSNQDPRFLRSRLRTQVLPLLHEAAGPHAGRNLARSADLVREYVEAEFLPQLHERFGRAADEHRLRLASLAAMPPIWQGRIILEALRRWLPGAPASLVPQIRSLVSAQPGRRVAAGAGSVWRGRAHLIFEHQRVCKAGATTVAEPGETIIMGARRLQIAAVRQHPHDLSAGGAAVAYADADRLVFPLTVRPWRAGDRIVPLGMTRAKKVSDVLTDAKVGVEARSAVHVVCSGDDIVLIAGVRLSELVRVRATTRRILRFAVL